MVAKNKRLLTLVVDDTIPIASPGTGECVYYPTGGTFKFNPDLVDGDLIEIFYSND